MSEPRVHIAYAPHGVGLLYAVLWFARGDDVHGWYIGSREGVTEASFFMMPSFFATKPVVLYRSVQDDLYGAWEELSEQGRSALAQTPPMPQPICVELAPLQDEFVRHRLFFGDDPKAQAQVQAFHARELPVCHVNVRAERLGKLHRPAAIWRYDTPGTDWTVLARLSQRWTLDEKVSSRDFEA